MHAFSTEQQQLPYYGNNVLLDLDVPPRKLLHRPGLTIYVPDDDQDQEPKFMNEEGKEIDEEGEVEEEEKVDTYSCDEFRMYDFKVRRCIRGRSHDWTDCPFDHPGEKARRRDPRRYHYSGVICPDFRRSGACPRGDACEYALQGRSPLPPQGLLLRSLSPPAPPPPVPRLRNRHRSHPSSGSARKPSCCAGWPVASSPTSRLMGFSSPISPPISPSGGAFHLSSRAATGNNENKNDAGSSSSGSYKGYGWLYPGGVKRYDSVPYELMSSLEAMELSSSGINGNGRRSSSSFGPIEERDSSEHQSSSNGGGPDLEWVNELLM